jgi:hypothetical protein
MSSERQRDTQGNSWDADGSALAKRALQEFGPELLAQLADLEITRRPVDERGPVEWRGNRAECGLLSVIVDWDRRPMFQIGYGYGSDDMDGEDWYIPLSFSEVVELHAALAAAIVEAHRRARQAPRPPADA